MTRNAIENARAQFEAETTEHRMTVLHDDGVYRHLRFARPGTGIWHWDIVTWPGHLAIAGDVGNGWSFSRLHDMLDFFDTRGGEHGIKPSYWWEKMPSQLRDQGKHYSEDLLEQIAREHIAEWDLDDDDKAAAQAQFGDVWHWVAGESEQRQAVRDFTFNDTDGRTHEFSDSWEWEAQDFDHHFLLALFAIVFAVRAYREYEAAIEAARAA